LDPSDLPDAHAPQCVAEYACDIFQHMKRTEDTFRVHNNYMSTQEDINEKMRSITVDWLVEVQQKFGLQEEVLYLAVNMVDRYLTIKPCKRGLLQLVGITCLFIAAKYEEIYPPDLRDFVHVTNDAFTEQQIIDMEMSILNTLQFRVTCPSPLAFLKRYMAIAGIKEGTSVYELALACLELTLTEMKVVTYSPSHLACSALFLAIRVMSMGEQPQADDISLCWPKVLIPVTGETDKTIRPCTKELVSILVKCNIVAYRAIYKKYARIGRQVMLHPKVQGVLQQAEEPAAPAEQH
jgi:cyclin B